MAKKDKSKFEIFTPLNFLLAVVVTIITVLTYFGLTPTEKGKKLSTQTVKEMAFKNSSAAIMPTEARQEPSNNNYKNSIVHKEGTARSNKKENNPVSIGNVSGDVAISQNQSGGITANKVTINTGPQPRHLTTRNFSDLQELIKINQGRKIKVICATGDNEANAYAIEIENYLRSQGADVEGIIVPFPTKPVYGHSIVETKDGYQIIVGQNQSN